MHATCDGDSLRRLLATFDLLDSGWRPGKAELDCARFIENWTVLPPENNSPFRIIGTSWTLPLSHTLFVTKVLALDLDGHWARTLDEWVVIGEPVDGSAAVDTREIGRTGAAWLWAELQRLPTSA